MIALRAIELPNHYFRTENFVSLTRFTQDAATFQGISLYKLEVHRSRTKGFKRSGFSDKRFVRIGGCKKCVLCFKTPSFLYNPNPSLCCSVGNLSPRSDPIKINLIVSQVTLITIYPALYNWINMLKNCVCSEISIH
jgi:hypothetical protein